MHMWWSPTTCRNAAFIHTLLLSPAWNVFAPLWQIIHNSAPPNLACPCLQSILLATQRSFAAMKRRLGSKTATGIFYMERPFFDVDVELKVGLQLVLAPHLVLLSF